MLDSEYFWIQIQIQIAAIEASIQVQIEFWGEVIAAIEASLWWNLPLKKQRA